MNQNWRGIGYPPIGSVCEVQYIYFGTQNTSWEERVVVGIDNGMVVFKVRDGKYGSIELDKVRPVRTKEQKEVDAIAELLRRNVAPDKEIKEVAQLMYDEGYRKLDND